MKKKNYVLLCIYLSMWFQKSKYKFEPHRKIGPHRVKIAILTSLGDAMRMRHSELDSECDADLGIFWHFCSDFAIVHRLWIGADLSIISNCLKDFTTTYLTAFFY